MTACPPGTDFLKGFLCRCQNGVVLGLRTERVREALCAANMVWMISRLCSAQLSLTIANDPIERERENAREHKQRELESYEKCNVWLSPQGCPRLDALTTAAVMLWLRGRGGHQHGGQRHCRLMRHGCDCITETSQRHAGSSGN